MGPVRVDFLFRERQTKEETRRRSSSSNNKSITTGRKPAPVLGVTHRRECPRDVTQGEFLCMLFDSLSTFVSLFFLGGFEVNGRCFLPPLPPPAPAPLSLADFFETSACFCLFPFVPAFVRGLSLFSAAVTFVQLNRRIRARCMLRSGPSSYSPCAVRTLLRPTCAPSAAHDSLRASVWSSTTWRLPNLPEHTAFFTQRCLLCTHARVFVSVCVLPRLYLTPVFFCGRPQPLFSAGELQKKKFSLSTG